jgi:hypothetical protein
MHTICKLLNTSNDYLKRLHIAIIIQKNKICESNSRDLETNVYIKNSSLKLREYQYLPLSRTVILMLTSIKYPETQFFMVLYHKSDAQMKIYQYCKFNKYFLQKYYRIYSSCK